jgi:hypothetical protein
VFFFSRDRRAEHPQAHLSGWSEFLQADAFGSYGKLYAADRAPSPVVEAACWAHARRKFFEPADIAAAARGRAQGKTAVVAPLALEAVQRMDRLSETERALNSLSPEQRLASRREYSAPLVADLEARIRVQRARLSRGASGPSVRRTAALAVAASCHRSSVSGGLTMPRVSLVLPAAAVAQRLDVSLHLVRLMAEEMSDETAATGSGVDQGKWPPAQLQASVSAAIACA